MHYFTKTQALELLKMLFELEAWTFSENKIMPDALCNHIAEQIRLLTDFILSE